MIALGKPLHAYGGIHTTHMRDEASQLVESVNETIEIGRSADIPVVISHHKASGTPNHGLVRDTLKLIDEARKSQKLGLDVYPYVAASTMLDARPHSARQQDHRHLVEEPARNSPGRRSTPSRRNSAAARPKRRNACCRPARSIS